MKFKTFQLLLLFFVTTFVFFAFSKGAFSQNIETPSKSVPEQIEIQGYGKFLKQGEEFFTLDGRKVNPFKKESGSSSESNIATPSQTQNNDQPSIQSHSGCNTNWWLTGQHSWSYSYWWFYTSANFSAKSWTNWGNSSGPCEEPLYVNELFVMVRGVPAPTFGYQTNVGYNTNYVETSYPISSYFIGTPCGACSSHRAKHNGVTWWAGPLRSGSCSPNQYPADCW